MNKGFHKTEEGNWSAPLPFRDRDIKIPNNKPQAEKRAKTLESSLRRDPVKKEHFFEFMQGILDSGHAERRHLSQEKENVGIYQYLVSIILENQINCEQYLITEEYH